MEAHHYCSILNDELIQCVIFDGNVKEAKIMGVEYIVSSKLFATLPENEKSMWHSHVYEVKSGQLIAPGIPEIAELELMEKLIGTYGKTFHTWHTDLQKELPLGVPRIMMGFTADGQIDPAIVGARDERFGINSEDKKQRRAEIVAPPILEGADGWMEGWQRDPDCRSHRHRTRGTWRTNPSGHAHCFTAHKPITTPRTAGRKAKAASLRRTVPGEKLVTPTRHRFPCRPHRFHYS